MAASTTMGRAAMSICSIVFLGVKMKIVYSDLETANVEPITSGSHKYSETVQIQLWAYAIDNGPVKVWDLAKKEPMPSDLETALEDENVFFCWHNQAFDRIQLRSIGIDIPLQRIIDTMVIAYRLSLPGGLDMLGKALGLPEEDAKMSGGRNLVLKFCKPNKDGYWMDHRTNPEDWERYKEYAKRDVVAMRKILRRLACRTQITLFERKVWELDQKINDRGFRVDTQLVEAAMALAEKERENLANRTKELTNGLLRSTTQRDALLRVLQNEYGVNVSNLREVTINRLLESDDIPATVKELLINRADAASASVSKYARIKQMTCSDGRIRGSLQYYGASRTGRWGGRGIQPQNLPRPKVKPWTKLEELIQAVKRGGNDFGEYRVMDVLSSALRGTIIASQGKKLITSDLSAIEGRVTAWLAEEDWRVEAFRRYDLEGGIDDYCMTYAKAFNRNPATVNEEERQIGKVMSLFFGYGGSVGAFVAGAATYCLDLDVLAEQALAIVPPEVLSESESFLGWVKERKSPRYGLSDRTFSVCHSLVQMWRRANPKTVSMWNDKYDPQNGLEGATRIAIANKGEQIPCRKLIVSSDDFATYIELPSGRKIVYPSMKVDADGSLIYVGTNQYTREWGVIRTYGGKLLENCAQAVSRDILAHGMLLAEKNGYEVILTVHDEIVSETTDSEEFSSERLSKLIATPPEWAADLPLAAKGFDSYRYRK